MVVLSFGHSGFGHWGKKLDSSSDSDKSQQMAETQGTHPSAQNCHLHLLKSTNGEKPIFFNLNHHLSQSTPFDPHIITRPAHYLEGRTIEPIHVIESWELCHHLACVVKYLARAGRKNAILEDLKKAEWYLNRTLEKELDPGKLPHSSYFPKMVRDDWNLSFPLGMVLSHIYGFKAFQSHRLLGNALECLRSELSRLAVEGEMS